MKILIFGATGFIGKKLVANLSLSNEVETAKIQDEESSLIDKIRRSEVIINASGVSRSESEKDFFLYNIYHSQRIFSFINRFEKKTYIYFSSIHYGVDSIYGLSKRYNEFLLETLGFQDKNYFLCLRIPSIFGPGLKPNYVSVVATFCNNLANNLESKIVDGNKSLQLLYVDDLMNTILYKIENRKDNGYELIKSFRETIEITVATLFTKIEDISHQNLNVEGEDKFSYNLQTTYNFYINKL